MLDKQTQFIEAYMAEIGSMDRLKLLIDWGDAQSPKPDPNMTKVEGCLSNVMYSLRVSEDGEIHFAGWSNSVLMAGFLQLCVYFYDGLNVADLTADAFDWIDSIELTSSVSRQRGVAITHVIDQLRQLRSINR